MLRDHRLAGKPAATCVSSSQEHPTGERVKTMATRLIGGIFSRAYLALETSWNSLSSLRRCPNYRVSRDALLTCKRRQVVSACNHVVEFSRASGWPVNRLEFERRILSLFSVFGLKERILPEEQIRNWVVLRITRNGLAH